MDSRGHLPVGTVLGNYELTAFLGEGGMGTVYSAVHRTLGKKVAIKTLRSELAAQPELRARFVREGKAAAAVRHPNVVDVDDVGIAGDTPYLAMELLEGEDLRARVLRHGRLRADETVDVVLPALLGLGEAHRAGVVHRDLKPDNIFLARDAHGGTVPKLLDFGISKLRETQSLGLTGNHSVLGTPFYMSPEQAGSARDVDARSDLYSAGVILYHCTVGRVPFNGSALAQVIGQIMLADPVPLRELCPDVPAGFEAVVLRCMAKDPAARFQDAISLARALLPFASARTQLMYGPILQPEGGEAWLATQAADGESRRYARSGRGSGLDQTPPPLSRSVAARPSGKPPSAAVWAGAAALLLLSAAGLGALMLRSRQEDPRPLQVVETPPQPPATQQPLKERPTASELPTLQPQLLDAGSSVPPPQLPRPVGTRRPRDKKVGKAASPPPSSAPAPAPTPEVDPVWGERR